MTDVSIRPDSSRPDRPERLLIRDAEVEGRRTDVLLADGRIARIGAGIDSATGTIAVLDARGGALLPGLHDHHIHLRAAAAARHSLDFATLPVRDPQALADALHDLPGDGWVRAIGYHPGLVGEIDRNWLDRHGPERPVRIQHRSGRMWIMNSAALALLGITGDGSGHVVDSDDRLASHTRLDIADSIRDLSEALLAQGVTGLTEATARNTREDLAAFAALDLPQQIHVMGSENLLAAHRIGRCTPTALKLHYHDHDLPALDVIAARARQAHEADRPVASHCTTVAELLVTLAAIEVAGVHPGDRIEHGSVVPPEVAEWVARLGLTVVSQPHFLTERADAYRQEVDVAEKRWLYRLGGLARLGIPLAAGTDAPFGRPDPWASMAAAVSRPPGFGEDEQLCPEQALALYTGEAEFPARQRRVEVGAVADLCVLADGWATARRNLAAVTVAATIVCGELRFRGAAPLPT